MHVLCRDMEGSFKLKALVLEIEINEFQYICCKPVDCGSAFFLTDKVEQFQTLKLTL